MTHTTSDSSQSYYRFPDPIMVDPDGYGLIALGGDLAPQTLLNAYSQGLFPWFNEGEPIAWWCPDPRCVLDPSTYQASKSLRKQVRKSTWQWSVNTAFDQVIEACSLPRSYSEDTWIHGEMIEAYNALYQMGFAHSIEVWEDGVLIGGLYGLKIGGIYFGESMFHHKSNASKVAFWALNQFCNNTKVRMIDCQLPNEHLQSMGATTLPRPEFLQKLHDLVQQDIENWSNHATLRHDVSQLI